MSVYWYQQVCRHIFYIPLAGDGRLSHPAGPSETEQLDEFFIERFKKMMVLS